jgi:glyoxylase-like metal-dependent hydrolase (beta-lactamase superfamily II)
MQVYRLPVLSDNYIFLLHDPDRRTAAVVDPAASEPVLQQLISLGAELTAIFNTHHHSDHVGGNQQLIDRFPQIKVYGGAEDRGRIPGQQVFLQAGDRALNLLAEAPPSSSYPATQKLTSPTISPPATQGKPANCSAATLYLLEAAADYLKALQLKC